MTKRTEAERFWAKVQKTDTCWLWTASLASSGYGQFVASGRQWKAHRWAYEHLIGPVPAGLQLDHLCHTADAACVGGHCIHRRCVNPAHLEPVTRKENILRGMGTSAVHARKTHCIHGHPFDEANTYVEKDGSRACRTCLRERARARRATGRR